MDRHMANALLNRSHYNEITAQGRIYEERVKKLSLDQAMNSFTEISGLSRCEFLFSFYQSEFVKLGTGDFPFEVDKLKRYTGLMGLCIRHFLDVDLPVPKRLLNPNLENTYSLGGEISPWSDYLLALRDADKEYSSYVEKWVDQQSGRKDYQLNSYTGKHEEIYFDPDFSLRLELGREFSGLFLDRLKSLLSLDKKASTSQILKRNLDLKDLIVEADQYSVELSSIMHEELKDKMAELEGTDPLSKLCVSSIMGSLYGQDFDIDAFEQQVIDILWTELVDLQKTDEQREQVQLVKRQISGEVYEGIVETEVE